MSTVTLTPAANAYTSSQYNYLNGTYFPMPFHLQQQQQPLQPYIGPSPSPISPPVAPVAVSGAYSLPQYQQAQLLFQRVAQTITPKAIENVRAAIASSEIEQKAEVKKKAVPRKAAGQTWEDPTLAEWPENDFRLFCGNLGNEGKYVGNRPVQLRKSRWKDRIDYEALVRRKNVFPKKGKSPKKSVLHK